MKKGYFAVPLLCAVAASALSALSVLAAPIVRFDQGLDLKSVIKEAREAASALPAVPAGMVPAVVVPAAQVSAKKSSEDQTSPWQSTVDSCQPKPPVSNVSEFVGAYKSCFNCQVFTYILDFGRTQLGIKCRPFPPREDDYEWRWEESVNFTGLIYAPGPGGALTKLKAWEHGWKRVRRERDHDRDRGDRRPGPGTPGDGGRDRDRDLPERP